MTAEANVDIPGILCTNRFIVSVMTNNLVTQIAMNLSGIPQGPKCLTVPIVVDETSQVCGHSPPLKTNAPRSSRESDERLKSRPTQARQKEEKSGGLLKHCDNKACAMGGRINPVEFEDGGFMPSSFS